MILSKLNADLLIAMHPAKGYNARVKKIYRRKFTKVERLKYFLMYNMQCFYCEKELELDGIEIDHFHPHSENGSNRKHNLIVSCESCNRIKGNKVFETYDDAKQYIRKQNPFASFTETNMPTLREGVFSSEKVAEMVQPKMQGQFVGKETKRQEEARAILDRVFGTERQEADV